jgi:hypothetical protein
MMTFLWPLQCAMPQSPGACCPFDLIDTTRDVTVAVFARVQACSRARRLIDHVLSADRPGPWADGSSSSSSSSSVGCSEDVQSRCAAELQLSHTLWTHLLSLASSSPSSAADPAAAAAAAAASSASQTTLTQMELLSLWLQSPLLRTYDYSDDEIIEMVTRAPSTHGRYDLNRFRAGFHRVFAVSHSNCSVMDMDVCARAEGDHVQHRPLVVDVGSSVGYFPFLSLSLGARVYQPPHPA